MPLVSKQRHREAALLEHRGQQRPRSCRCRPGSRRGSAARSAESARRGSAARSSRATREPSRRPGVGAAERTEHQGGGQGFQIHARSIVQSRAHGIFRRDRAVNIADLRLMAKRRLPRMVFDYIDGGAEREWTLRENMRAFEDVMFRPRSAVATATCDLEDDRARLADRSAVHPRARRQQPDVLSARRRGSGVRGRRGRHDLHACRRCPAARWKTSRPRRSGNAWYQLYLVGGRDVALKAIARAKAARLQGAGRHHRYAGGRHARARCAQRRQATARAEPVDASRISAR